jgi:hypothetical protein
MRMQGAFLSGQCICAVRCRIAVDSPSARPFGMRSHYRRVFPDMSRIRTITDVYRDACPYEGGLGGLSDSLMVATADDGIICLVHRSYHSHPLSQ